MDKMVEELEKNVEENSQNKNVNPIFAENPYKKVIESNPQGIGRNVESAVIKRGNSTRYSNFYGDE